MNDLPRRPLQPLAAPPGAFERVSRRARARRTRTGLLAAGLGLALAATGVVAAMPTDVARPDRIEPLDHSPSPEPASADADEVAARVFIDAWRERDAARMRTVAYDDGVVEAALAHGTPEGPSDCTTQRSGQYQCTVRVAQGKLVYILVGEPDQTSDGRDLAGRVWHVGPVYAVEPGP